MQFIPPDEESEKIPARTRKNLLFSLTIEIIKTYELANPNFKPFDASQTPQRVLTQPSVGVTNGGRDNEDHNLICKVYDKLYVSEILRLKNSEEANAIELKSSDSRYYTVLDLLGMGTFGQVFRCQQNDSGRILAVKVVKNKPAYHDQALLEIKIAKQLNNQYDPDDNCHIVRYVESFEYCNHVCLVFELLSMSLLGKLNTFFHLIVIFKYLMHFSPLFLIRRVDSKSVSRFSTFSCTKIYKTDSEGASYNGRSQNYSL